MTKRKVGICPDCRLYVYVRRDGTAYRHRMRHGAEDQICEGSGYPVPENDAAKRLNFVV